MIERDIAEQARGLATWFPVVSVTGPRQSGKSTLVRSVFDGYDYVNLEDPQVRGAALDDPVGFIKNRPDHLIIDEAQYAPELFSMVQVASDERGSMGQYILSGSQNFLMLKAITQSLAGRVGMLKLLPLSYHEALRADPSLSGDAFMLAGGYPRIYDVGLPLGTFFENYVSTYLERDVSGYLDVRNLAAFRTFLGLCARNCGRLLRYVTLEQGAQISHDTARAWLSMLESSYVTFMLRPYHANLGKRLTKTPKLYFYDTGLLCYLLGIKTLEQLLVHPMLGAVFENLVIAERMKRHLNGGDEPELCFYRDDSKVEVDLLDLTDAASPELMEIKSSETYRPRFARHLGTVGETLGVPPERRAVVARVGDDYTADGVTVRSARSELLGSR
ncbi:MAG: ATP-binding protein [Atopobiaceae bacterium]|jgi:predicted AAA+ superfamily ATPase|nr:ATP-binding protein [Atopobiaceae bacterium]MCH4276768.1 ATP-binding protein [Atopobiaceae bacterium]MCI1226584.1 ATP-binding protein [Atopobiaceae bacterium]MCI1260576.1 ATP-binding protein [Atopobiaceae bacterium]MDD2588013.1 ATP-binding protein [Atopobiaceae bacterium]